jgi:hypothetical protein
LSQGFGTTTFSVLVVVVEELAVARPQTAVATQPTAKRFKANLIL